MNIDAGAIATYIGLMGGAFVFLAGTLYKLGRLAHTFESHVSKIAAWEHAIGNLNRIPELQADLEALSEKFAKHEEATLRRFDRHTSDISDLRANVSRIHGRVSSMPSKLTP